ncbi:MAG: transketolase [Verrucomicrobia bacterium]|nr:transketolase [Verrucomicrobiota bacterium]
MNKLILQQAARDSRGLAMDAVTACKSGHLGLPLGSAELGAVLFGELLKLNPAEPRWLNRDRFVLSAGHGSMFLYGWLHLAGFAISLDDLKKFRALHSLTPGHPEFHHTPGVEATTGPLGQGVANAVGLAISGRMAAARFNTAQHQIFDHHVVCLAGDGCLQEGVSAEASSLAGHLGLDNLILFHDANRVTLDAMLAVSESDDTAARYRAYGWDVQEIDGHNIGEIEAAFKKAKAAVGKPQFIISRTMIGKGIPEVAGTNKAHGEAGVKYTEAARKALGLPDEKFFVSPEVRDYFEKHKEEQIKAYEVWKKTYEAWRAANADLAASLDDALNKKVPDLLSAIPEFPPAEALATRKAGGIVLNVIAKKMPLLITGSADLFGSTMNYLEGLGDLTCETPAGRNIHFGIREHAMAAIMNGIAYDGIFQPSGATFLVFSDYARPSIRLAALSNLPVIYIFTHDSVAVGEDGPTHEPVETVAALRAIPGLDVIRPADPEETAGAFAAAYSRTDGPTLFVLCRQNLPNLNDIPVSTRRQGVARGAYIARKETKNLEMIIMATGSELQIALEAAKQLGEGTRVVSMPCMERFLRQDVAYQEEILPKVCRKRISIEAGISQPWFQFIGLDGKSVAINRFGLSAPGAITLKELGMTAESIVAAAQQLIAAR